MNEAPKPKPKLCHICDFDLDANGNCTGLLKGVSFARRMHGLEDFP